MTNLNDIPIFLLMMQTRSTQKTALKLGRSQSYVSKVLAQLRHDLNDPLFIRNANGLTPTSYAVTIEPKLRAALEQVEDALLPDEFDPSTLDKVVLHIVEPYLVASGKVIIETLREQTGATIELRMWNKLSETLIEEEAVDLGVHILNDKPQMFYQKRLHSGAAYFDGNTSGEYVKYLVSGVNDYNDHFRALDPTIKPSIFVDNYQLMNQLMESCYTLRYAPHMGKDEHVALNLDLALIVKSSKRNSPKIKWLMALIEPILNRSISQW